jgi:hypothetical protein
VVIHLERGGTRATKKSIDRVYTPLNNELL